MDRLAQKGKVAGLARALSYEDLTSHRDRPPVDLGAPVRARAAEALARFEGADIDDLLLQALRDPEEQVRSAAIRAFRARGGSQGINALLSAVVQWTGPELERSRSEALEALAGLRARDVPRRAANELIARPEDLGEADLAILPRLARAVGDDLVRVTIEVLVTHLGEGPVAARARKLLIPFAPDCVDPLVGALADPARRRDAALTLGSIHDSRAVDPLCDLVLDGAEPAEREAAAWALGEIRDPGAVEALLRATRDSDYAVRNEAIAGFDKLGNAAITIAIGGMMQRALEAAPAREPEPPAVGTRDPGELTEAEPETPAAATAETVQRPVPAPVQSAPGQAVAPPAPAPAGRPRPVREALAERAAPLLRRLLEPRDVSGSR